MVLVLSIVAIGGRAAVTRMKWAADPNGWFKKIIALLLVLVGVAMLIGWDKDVERYLLEHNITIDTTMREGRVVRSVTE